ncbi:MAG TPA: tetratricopeptide repeat protein, partial [Phototrophicaceae bacterium]|nr:tetratricopeptide repeat protein [Phototrophicaceae bacterium]
MQIKRDYSQPFFSNRRRRRFNFRFLLVYLAVLAGFLFFVNSQFDRLQLMALDAVGMAPTATPFASWYAAQGYDAFLVGKLDDAAKAFEQAVSQQRNNVSYLYEYGRLLIELNKPGYPEKAIELGDQAIQAAPNDPRGYTIKAGGLVWSDDPAAAVPVALTGLEADPNFAPLHAVLARAYTTIGRYQQGLNYGESGVQLDPMNIDARRAYAYALIWVGEREEATRQLEDAVTINPNLPTAYFELAAQYRAAEEYELAVATYERILSLDQFNTKALLRLCETFSQVRDDAQAQGYCEDAISI